MTRLQSDNISDIASQLPAYDEELLLKTGHTLRQIACHAVKLTEEDARPEISNIRVGIVPVSWGQGVIEGFCKATAGILMHLGFDPFITTQPNIAGLAEAYRHMADAVFLSDDNDFVALNAATRQSVHNSAATGKGFVAGLDLMAAGLADKNVLVLGCGAVGQSAVNALLSYGAYVAAYDLDYAKCLTLKKSFTGAQSDRVTVLSEFHAGLSGHALVVDATNAAGIIRPGDVSPQTFIAAPGMPLGLSLNAQRKLSDRLLHDPLQIGVATMGLEIVKQVVHHDIN